jgi:alcohol dehydrogenase, propanol-preferring
LGFVCGICPFCKTGRENLCDRARFTGYQMDGGYAEYTVANERFTFALPGGYAAAQAAPLLCAGLIGYRSLVLAGEACRLGLYGFGAAAHIITQVARHQGREVYAFTKPGDRSGQNFARELGALWAGDSDTLPPAELDAAILFAPVGNLVPLALRAVAKGGTVVCAGIHMSEIPSFPYKLLWGERAEGARANYYRNLSSGRRQRGIGQAPNGPNPRGRGPRAKIVGDLIGWTTRPTLFWSLIASSPGSSFPGIGMLWSWLRSWH